LAINNRQIYFQYHNSFIEQNLNILAFHLPLKPTIFNFDYNLFEGLAEGLQHLRNLARPFFGGAGD
jgi:hypothetical protein